MSVGPVFSPSPFLGASSVQKRWALLVVILGPFMAQLDSTLVNVALSSIRDDFGADMRSVQWVTSGYLTALALALPLNTWFLSFLGVRRLYLLCFALFTTTSVFCGLATSLTQLIVGRLFQGVAGGLLAPLTQFMLARIAGDQLARVIGFTAAPILLAPLLGPSLAGLVLRVGKWPWLFFLNLPLGLLSWYLAYRFLPQDDDPGLDLPRKPTSNPAEASSEVSPASFDGLGFFLLSPGLAALLLGSGGRGLFDATWKAPALMGVGVFLLSWFVIRSFRASDPEGLETPVNVWVDLHLLRIPAFLSAIFTQFLVNGILFAGQFLIPLYFISGVGMTPDQAGWRLSITGLGLILIYPWMGYLTDRFGAVRVARVGSGVALLGVLPFLVLSVWGYQDLSACVGLFFRGVGQGATGVPALALAYLAVPRSRLRGAATTVNLIQRLGGPLLTLGVSIALPTLVVQGPLVHSDRGFSYAFAVLTGFHLVAVLATSRLIQEDPQKSGTTDHPGCEQPGGGMSGRGL
jgi:EmrB/QacA subfamily drug resistance transporter